MTKEQLKRLEADLWRAADALRANSDLKSNEYSSPVLGLIFLKFADNTYRRHESAIAAEFAQLKGTRREKTVAEIAVEKCGFFLPDHARYDYLLNLPEEKDVARALKEAMKAIEAHKPELEGALPKDEYARLTRTDRTLPNRLLKTFADIPADAGGDLFGQIYEYFLAEFARGEGQKGGEFFTPRSVVRLMVEMIEPHGGRVFDPACGSGGMFVQSARFIEEHRKELARAETGVYVYGQEKTRETVNLARMNLAVNGLRGEIKQANTYTEDPFGSFGAFDYVLANPPFNVDEVNLGAVEKDRRFNTYGIPRKKTKANKKDAGKETVPNANYLWINLFATSLKAAGRAALVMANSASDARHSEADIRRRLIDANLISMMLTLPSNMFYTVTLPATLWFFDKAKPDDRILFIDARNIFTPVDRAHREFSGEQIRSIAVIARLRQGRREAFVRLVDDYFAAGLAALEESRKQAAPVCRQVEETLEGAAEGLMGSWGNQPVGKNGPNGRNGPASSSVLSVSSVSRANAEQRGRRERFEPFFAGLHEAVRRLDKTVREHEKQQGGRTDRKTKALKTALEALHAEVKHAESFFAHIRWLQDRFPEAKYEDVTGLCKLATPAEVREQDYSLNPGRYVGVVIEEDGKTEEEFAEEMLQMADQLAALNKEAHSLENVIADNLKALVGEG